MKSRRSSSQKRAFYQRRGVWVTVILLLLAGSGAAWYFLRGPDAAQPAALAGPQMLITEVKLGDITISASGSGTLVASQSVDLSFSTGGTVAELNVKVGDMVEAGVDLARLGNALDLEANLASAQLQLLKAQQALQELQQSPDLSLAQAYQELLAAQEAYNGAETASQRTAYGRCSQEVRTRYALTLERTQQKLAELTEKDYGSDSWIDARHDYDTALANNSYCSGYTAEEKTTAQAGLDIAAAALKQAEEMYGTLKDASGVDPDALALAEAEVYEAEKLVNSAQEDLDGIRLTAPITGKVTYLAAGQGAVVDTATFITISDVSQPTIDVSVDETDLDKLVVGTSAAVIFDALPDQTFSGTVVQADPSLTASGPYRVAKGLVTLDAEAAKIVQNLPLGVSASVMLISQQITDVLVVPVAVLQELANQEYAVLVVGSDGETTLQTVQVGLQDSENVQITAGLAEGQRVSMGISESASNAAGEEREGEMIFPIDGPMPGGGGMLPQP